MSTTSYNKSVLLVFVLVFTVLAANSVLTYTNLRTLDENKSLVERQHHKIAELRALLKLVVDSETGQRGYLITGDKAFQAPYVTATAALQDKLKSVEELIAGDTEGKAAFAKLSQTIRQRMDTIERSITLRDEQGLEAARMYILEGTGKRLMDDIRAQVEGLEEQERDELDRRDEESVASYWTALVTGLMTSVLALLLAIAGYVLISRDLEKRNQLSEDLQKSKERLEERVRARTMEIEASNSALKDEIQVRLKAEQAAMLAAQELQRSNRELEQFASVASHGSGSRMKSAHAIAMRLNSLKIGRICIPS